MKSAFEEFIARHHIDADSFNAIEALYIVKLAWMEATQVERERCSRLSFNSFDFSEDCEEGVGQ